MNARQCQTVPSASFALALAQAVQSPIRWEVTRIFIRVSPTLGMLWVMSIVIAELSAAIVPSIRTVLAIPSAPHCMSALTVAPETLNAFIVQSPSARFLTRTSDTATPPPDPAPAR